jgi:cytochrome c-type biogenesis protein CcmH
MGQREEMKASAIKLFFLTFFLTAPSFAYAVDQPLNDPLLEARAVAIGNELRCVVCQSESVEDSQADMARDLRRLVRDKIASGWSDRQVIDYVRARYGDFILLRPPVQANTILLWLSPLLIFGMAAGCMYGWLRRGAPERKEMQ